MMGAITMLLFNVAGILVAGGIAAYQGLTQSGDGGATAVCWMLAFLWAVASFGAGASANED